MTEKIKKEIFSFENDLSIMERDYSNIDINSVLLVLTERIKEMTNKYLETDNLDLQEKLRMNLIRNYNLLYYYQAKANGIRKAYVLDNVLQKLPNVYMVEQRPERFNINADLLDKINIEEGLTEEQALELLKWTVNNTRDNLIIAGESGSDAKKDVYGNSSLVGLCGFSQFSTLYPLQKLGLEVTINNVGEVFGGRHAYGTVVIPIKYGDKIINKRFLLDCTYRQFFTLPFNVVTRYFSHSPFAGFFVTQDEEQIKFAKELLRNGFIEASLENLEKYLKPFFSGSVPLENVSEIDEKFSQLSIFEIVEKKQEAFDYTEEEFCEWGCNLNIKSQDNKRL